MAEVNSWGGFEKQYQVRIDSERLIKHKLPFAEVVTALENNNRNTGGGGIQQNNQFPLVQGLGRTVSEEQIRNIVVTAKDGSPIRVKDVATVGIGQEIRRGSVTAMGRGEVVLGLCFMTMEQNSKIVTRLTVVFTLVGSLVLSMTLMPVLASFVLARRMTELEPLLMRLAHAIHNPILKVCMNHRLAVVTFAACLLVFAFGMVAPNLGAEFIPRLSEGAIAMNVVRLAGTDLSESNHLNSVMERMILEEFPDEVRHTWSRVGTAAINTDPMGIELTDMYVTLRPCERWRKARTQEELTELLEKLIRQIPGQKVAFEQPIEMRISEMATGTRSDVAIFLFGDDFELLTSKGAEITAVLNTVAGNADVSVEQLTGQPVLQVRIRQDEIARYGIAAKTLLDLVASAGGLAVGEAVEGQLRFPLTVRLPDHVRISPEALGLIQIATATGERIPLSRLAELRLVEGPSTITRNWGQRRISITCNVRGRDIGSFVAEARAKVAQQVTLPLGRYSLEWGGQFENYERARNRLLIVIPIAIAMIFTLLFFTYRNVIDALRVFTGVPFGWVGGIIALWLRDMPFSISAWWIQLVSAADAASVGDESKWNGCRWQ